MKAINAKQEIIKSLISKGFNFGNKVDFLSTEQVYILRDLAKQFKYKGSNTNYYASSIANQFYLHLQKIYYKMK